MLQRILVKIATGCVLRVFRHLTVLIVYICPVLDDGLFVLVAARRVVFFIYEVVGHILLRDPIEGLVVRVQIILSLLLSCGIRVDVLQVSWYRAYMTIVYVFHGSVYGLFDRVRFRTGGKI